MRKISLSFCLLCLYLGSQLYAQSETGTAALFSAKCATCHTIGGGRLVGRDLAESELPAWV